MSYKWGNTVLRVAKYSYNPPQSDNGVKEIPILPDSSGNPASVLQQGGRGRYEVSFTGYANFAEYSNLFSDYYDGRTRTFEDADGWSMTAVIKSIKAVREVDPYEYVYAITLMEV